MAAFTVAVYSLHPVDRTDKSLEGLLNETFELMDEQKGIRYVCETVGTHQNEYFA